MGEDYLRPYEDAVEKSGAGFDALLWNGRRAQTVRFDTLASMVEMDGRVVCDLGCGLADLAARLTERGVAYTRYIGVEGVPALAREANARFESGELPRGEVIEGDFAADEQLAAWLVRERGAQVFVCSGSLNTFGQARTEAALDRVWRAVRGVEDGALVFNFLSDTHGDPARVGEDTGPATRMDTARLVAWAMERTPMVAFRQDHLLGHDGAIAMMVRPDTRPSA